MRLERACVWNQHASGTSYYLLFPRRIEDRRVYSVRGDRPGFRTESEAEGALNASRSLIAGALTEQEAVSRVASLESAESQLAVHMRDWLADRLEQEKTNDVSLRHLNEMQLLVRNRWDYWRSKALQSLPDHGLEAYKRPG